MKDKKSRESRRKLLKSIAAGSGAIVAGNSLPENWSKPVVDSVMIPVHAQTSPFSGTYHFQQSTQAYNNDSETFFAHVLGSTVATANAGGTQPPPTVVDYCVDVFSDGTWRAAVRVTENSNLIGIWWTQTDGTVGGPAILMTAKLCGITHPPVTFQVPSGSTDQVNVVIMEGALQNPVSSIPAGTCPFSDPGDENCPMDSDRNIKENFTAVNEQDILTKVAKLPIEMWNYTDRETGVRHIGPMAQDFYSSFGVGGSDKVINMVDANGVNLAAIKALNAKLEEKDEQIGTLQEQLNELMRKLDKLS